MLALLLQLLTILPFIRELITTIVLETSEIAYVLELRTLLNKDSVDRLIHQIAEQSLKVVVARAKAPPDTGFRFPKIKIAW